MVAAIRSKLEKAYNKSALKKEATAVKLSGLNFKVLKLLIQ